MVPPALTAPAACPTEARRRPTEARRRASRLARWPASASGGWVSRRTREVRRDTADESGVGRQQTVRQGVGEAVGLVG